MKTKWIQLLRSSLTLSVLFNLLNCSTAYAVDFVNSISIPGNTPDLTPNAGVGGANINRLGFFSDLYYDRHQNVYYGLSDRGPGGGVLTYNTRVQKFSLDVDPNTGAISNFQLLATIPFTNSNNNYNGLNPQVLNGDKSILGLSFDPEGFVVAPNGNFYVSDEYGPSLYEFTSGGEFLRAFTTPDNIIPKENGTANYVNGRPTITTGRQDNRGFEGVAMSPDGTKLYGMLQDPLVNEGSPDGRFSQNLRIIEFDTTTGQSTAQYIYQLESLTDINTRVPSNTFNANAQGRNIGISAIIALNSEEFLVLERDNRGFGVEDPLAAIPVASKRVYQISLSGATDVSSISLAGTNTLPGGVNPVNKSGTPFIDVATALQNAGVIIPEKLEGLTIGPRLNDGSYMVLLGTDNDYSVTQNASNTQFDVCTDLTTSSQVTIDSGCPGTTSLIPGYLYSFKASVPGYAVPVSVFEPTGVLGLLAAGSLFGLHKVKKAKK